MVAFAPPGGIANLPALVQGEDGKIPVFRNINVVELEPDDPTDASAEWVLAVEATDTVGPLYDLTLTLPRGAAGCDGVLTLPPPWALGPTWRVPLTPCHPPHNTKT